MGRWIAFRRWRKWAAILAIFAFGIPFCAALLIRSSQAHTRLRDLAIQAIQDETGLRASLGRVQIELFPFGIVARDVALEDPVYGRLADAERIRIRPSLRALMRGSIDLASIELEEANVRFVVRDGKVRNLPRIESGGDDPVTLPFRELAIRRSTLTVDASPVASCELRGVEATVRGERGGVIDVETRITSGAIEHTAGREEVRRLAMHIEVARDALRVLLANLEAGPLRLVVRDGFVPLPLPDPRAESSAYVGEIELDYDLAHLGTLPLPITLPSMRGQVALRARVLEDSTRGQRAVGTIHLDQAGVLEFGLGDTVRLAFEATPEEVRITRGEVHIRDGGGRVGITGRIGLTAELPVHLRAEVDDLSFAHLMDQLSVSQNSLVEWIFDGQLLLQGSLRDLALEGPIDLRTRDFFVDDAGYRAAADPPILAIPRAHFRGRWSIQHDAVRFFDLVGDLPHSRLFGDVLLGFHNELRVQARAEPADLRDVSPLAGFRMGGVGTVTCHVDGVFQDPRVTGHVRIDDFVFDGFRLGRVESDAILDRDGLGVTFPRVEGVKDESRYTAEGLYLDFHRRRFRLTSRLRLDRMRLHDFYHVFGFDEDERFTPYQGVAHGEATLEYTHGYPGDSRSGTLHVDLNLGLSRAELNGYVFDEGWLAGRWRWLDWSRGYEGGELDLDHLVLRKGGGTVTLQGRMALGGALQMTAAADAIPLRHIEGLGDRFPGLDGVANVTGQVGGTLELMRVDMDVGLTDVVYAGRPIGNGRAYVRMTHQGDPWVQDALGGGDATPPARESCLLGRLGLARASWPPDPPLRTVHGLAPRLSRPSAFVICGTALDGRVAIDLAVGRTRQYPVRGRVTLDGLELGGLLRAPGAAGTRARVSGDIVFDDGGLLRPETLIARVALDELEFGHGDLVFANRGPVRLEIKDGIVSVDRARFRGPDSRIRVRGQYAMPAEGRDGGLALAIDADVDLGVLARVSPAVLEANGRARTRLALSGALTDPEIYGDAALAGGMLRIAGLPTSIDDLVARVTFSARSVVLEDVRGRIAGGEVRGHGQATFSDGALDRYAVRLAAQNLSLAPAEGLQVSLSADGELTWSRGQRLPTLRGEVRVERLVYARNIDIGYTLGELARTPRAQVVRYDPEADRVAIDLRIVALQPLILRNNLVEAELVIDDSSRPFRIVGTDQRFGAVGNMQFARGRVFFRNAVFDVTSGSLSFDDEARVNPRFDVRALTEVVRRSGDLSAPRWRILLEAQGTTDSFEITTRSDPDLPQEDVLMLLAVGLTRGELGQLQGGDLGSTAALEALSALTGVDREIRRALPLVDDFRFTTAYSVRTGRTEPQVSVGRRISDRVRISAVTGIGAGSTRDFRAVVDMQLTEDIGVQCSYDTYGQSGTSFGNAGCDLRWRLEFE